MTPGLEVYGGLGDRENAYSIASPWVTIACDHIILPITRVQQRIQVGEISTINPAIAFEKIYPLDPTDERFGWLYDALAQMMLITQRLKCPSGTQAPVHHATLLDIERRLRTERATTYSLQSSTVVEWSLKGQRVH